MSGIMTEMARSGVRSPDAPKKRVITPARKAQNRAAQQAYRERQRQRKAHVISQRGVTKQLAPRPSTASRADKPPICDQEVGKSLEDSPENPKSRSIDKINKMCLGDPKMNFLRTMRDAIWEAVLNNAICLNFDLSLLADCNQAYISPFFRSVTAQDQPQHLVASTFDPTIPVHLQPTMAQILVPHHASLDLIPLPLLRDRVIMMSFAMPDIFDLWDLKLDIYDRNALVYRPTGSDEGQSWDQNSWKAASWFLQKWCLDWVKELAVSGES